MTCLQRATTLALIFAVCSAPAAAQQKIAFMRGQALLNAAPGIAERKALLSREEVYFQGEITKMTDSLQKMQQSFQEAEATLSPATRDARRKAIQDQLEKFQNATDSLRGVAARRQEEVLQPILDAVNKVLETFRSEESYAAIINLDDTPAVVAYDKNLDVTDALIARVKRITPTPPPPTIVPSPKKIPPGPGRGGQREPAAG
jgi:Skp family chaperone for outer membrane proteins